VEKLWQRTLVLCLTFIVLAVGIPTVGVAAVEEAVSADTENTVLPLDENAAPVLGITPEQVAALRADIMATALAFEEDCDIRRYGIVYSDEVNTCLSALIRNSMPETFHISTWSFYRQTGGERLVTRVHFAPYWYTKREYQEKLEQCDAIARQLTADLVDSDLTDEYKALLLHDRLAAWVDYDNAGILTDTVTPVDHTMYGALCNRLAVCDGYAKAYIYLLHHIGMESYICRSSRLAHAWNIVQVDGEWYHVDVTWDDPVWDVTGRVNHKFFLLSSDGIYEAQHTASDYDTTPTDTRFESKDLPWYSSVTAFQYLNGRVYYIDNTREMLRYREGTAFYDAVSVEDDWRVSETMGYTENFARLSMDGEYLYYSLSKAVYRYYPETGKTEAVYSPKFTSRPYHNIYGMRTEAGMLYCDVTDTPNYDAFTKKFRQERVPIPAPSAVQCGNVDGDGQISSTDARLVLQYAVRKIDGTGIDRTAADVNGDGNVDSTDARLILQYAVRKINEFPAA